MKHVINSDPRECLHNKRINGSLAIIILAPLSKAENHRLKLLDFQYTPTEKAILSFTIFERVLNPLSTFEENTIKEPFDKLSYPKKQFGLKVPKTQGHRP